MPGMALGGYQQASGGPTGASLQAPIKGLRAAMGGHDEEVPSILPQDPSDDQAPDRSALGVRQPGDEMQGLMDAMRRFGRVY